MKEARIVKYMMASGTSIILFSNAPIMMKKLAYLILFLFTSLQLFAQEVDRFCNENVCGDLEPNWELAGQSVVCEGIDFNISGSTSKPLDNINRYYWFIEDLRTSEVFFETSFADTTLLTYNYSISDSLACTLSSNKITLQVRLVTTSPTCGDGDQSCRHVIKPLTVFLKPRARFTAQTTICVGETLQLTNNSCHGETWRWDFGDGDISTEESPSKVFDTPGIYTIELTAENDCGSDIATRQIEVVGLPEADFDADLGDGSFCLPKVLDLSDRSNSFSNTRWDIIPSTTGDWMFTDTLMTPTSKDIQVRFLQPDEYTIRLTASNECPEDNIKEATINIFRPPNVQMVDSLSFCDEANISTADLNFSVSGDYNTVEWQFENASVASASGENFSNVRFTQTGKVTAVIEGPCETITQTADIFVASTEQITLAPDNPNELCQNTAPIQLMASPPGGRWEGPGGIEANGTFDPSNLSPGQYVFSYNAGSAACPNAADLTINILPAVAVELQEVDPACDQLSFTPQVQYTGDIDRYAWTFPGGNPATANIATPMDILFSGADTFLVEVIVEGQCGLDTANARIEIQEGEAASITDIDQPLCNGSEAIQLQSSPAGGQWSGTGVTIDGLFDPAQVSPDNSYTIRYELNSGACSSSAEISIEVVSSASLTVDDLLLCEDSPPEAVEVNLPGGNWSGSPAIDSMTGIFDASISGVGDFEITYQYTDENGCVVSGRSDVRVEARPQLQLLDTIQLCLADFEADLPALSNYTAMPEGGQSSWSGPGIISASLGLFNAASDNLDPAVYNIQVEYERNACSVSSNLAIDLIEAEALSLTPDTTVCISEGSLQLFANLSGGQWTGPAITPDGTIDLGSAGGGAFTYEYSFGTGTSCAQVGSVSVEIIDLGSQINTGGTQSACEGPGTTQLMGASPAGGFWQGPGIIDATNGIIDLSQIDTDTLYTYQYCLESSAVADCQACRPKSFILHSKPAAAFQLMGNACINQAFDLTNESSGAETFAWTFGDGNTSTATSPTHTYIQAGTYDLQLEATSAFACKDTSIQSVYVSTPPSVSFNLDEDEGCAPFTVQTTNQSSGDSLSYLWRVGTQTFPGEILQDIVIDSITEDTRLAVILEVSNFCGTVNQIDSILVRPYPLVNFGISEDEGCSPLEIDLINTTQGNPDMYSWDLGNGETSGDLEPPNPRYTTTDTLISTYDIQLIASNECGVDTLVKQVTVFPPNVEAFIELDTLAGCSPLNLQLKSVSTPGANLSWTFLDPLGQESGSAMENPILNLETAGLHTFILAASNCGTDMDTAQVEVLPAPMVTFEHRPFICLGQEIQFTNQSEGINGSIWDFGDGSASELRSPSHSYDSVGTYTVTLTAFSSQNNCPSTTTSTIEVLGLPLASFESNRTQGCGPLQVNFSNTSPNAESLNFVWDFGDGSSRVFTQNTEHTFQEPGNYQVMLTAYNPDSCFADTSLLNIFVFDDPISAFDVLDDRFCAGVDSLQLQNNSENAVSYLWQINDSLIDRRDLIYPLTVAGDLDIRLTVQNNFQCSDTSRKIIRVSPSPKAAFTADRVEGCEDLLVGFRQNAMDADRFVWDFGNGNQSTDPNPTHIFRESGEYTVQLTAQSTNGCPEDTSLLKVNILEKPIAGFTFDKPAECGTPTEVNFTNNSVGSLDNLWTFGDGISSDETSPTHFYVDFGPKTVGLIVTAENGCRDTTQQIVDVFGAPAANFQFSSAQVCAGDTLRLVNTSSEAFEYLWQIQGQGSSTETVPELIFPEAGTYEVALIATYNDLCRDTTRNFVQVFQAPIADFDYETDFDPAVLGEVQFNNLSIQAERYLWEFGDGNISQEVDPYYEYLVNRSLDVTLTAYNDNSGVYTCVDTVQKPVDPEWLATFYAPNALAPDLENDGVRFFKPVGTGLKTYKIEVYSPWGTRVWQSTELNDGQPVGRWDGSYNGQALPQGAYTWVATMTFDDGNKQRKVGTVTILR
jgi:PKD repeat protein